MRTLIVIPTYNELENLASVIAKTRSVGVDVLVVDDASADGTGVLADELAQANPEHVFVMHRGEKMGLGSAYIDGFRWGRARGYDILGEMDADGSHDPAMLPNFLDVITQGADVVIGSRRVGGGKIIGWGIGRHVASFLVMHASRWLLGLKTRDVPSGFRLYRAWVIDRVTSESVLSGGYTFQEEMVARCEWMSACIVEVPITFRDRERGISKASFRDVREFFRVMFMLRKERIGG